MIELGLATNKDFVYRLIAIATKKHPDTIPKLKITCEDFKKLTISSRLVNRILKILNTTTATMLK